MPGPMEVANPISPLLWWLPGYIAFFVVDTCATMGDKAEG
jgi:hypothetical protein